MIKAVEDQIRSAACASVIHVVREIVKVEQICEEVVAKTQLGVCSIRIAHGSEETSFQSMVLGSYWADKIVTLEQPPLGLASYSFAVSADTKSEVAVGDEVWEDELSCTRLQDGVDRRDVCVERRHGCSKLVVAAKWRSEGNARESGGFLSLRN